MRLLLSVTAVATILFACSSSSKSSPSTSSGSDGGTTTSPDGGATAAGGEPLTCSSVVVCAVDCPDTPPTCGDDCFARGSPSAQKTAQALADCLSANNCQDEACAKSKCGTELDACLNDAPMPASPAPAPGGQTALSGELVGTWSWVTSTGGTLYTFDASGTYVEAFRYEATNCLSISKVEISKSGIVEATDTSLTLTPTKATNTSYDCSSTPTEKTIGLTPEAFTYAFGTNDSGVETLLLTGKDGSVTTYTRK